MIKDIRYGGYTARPSDYESPDGDLAEALNFVPENGSLRPVEAPRLLGSFPGKTLRLIHAVPATDIRNYIFTSPLGQGSGRYNLYYCPDTENADPALIDNFPLVEDIASLGNTLILLTREGIVYLLWKDGGYRILGNRPPFVSIDFGLLRDGSLVDRNEVAFYDMPRRLLQAFDRNASTGSDAKDTPTAKKEIYDSVIGTLLSGIADKALSQGRFYQPFFIRYAVRMYDGSYNWHSAPVLMVPTTVIPMLRADNIKVDGSSLSLTVDTSGVNLFSICYRVLAGNDFDVLAAWRDIVAGIDVFVSAPVYTYDQSKDTFPAGADILVSSEYIMQGGGSGIRPGDGVGDTAAPDPVERFVGRYMDSGATYRDHYSSGLPIDRNNTFWNIPPNEKFHRQLVDTAAFYRIASFDIDDIKSMDGMALLPLDSEDLSSLLSRSTLPDDYQSHCRLVPHRQFVYNSRLNVADVDIFPAATLPLRSSLSFGNPSGGASLSAPAVTVFIRKNGTILSVTSAVGSLSLGSPSAVDSLPDNLPRFLFYPDPDAFLVEIKDGSRVWSLPLKPHDFLNGAYWYDRMNTPPAVDKPTTAVGTVDRFYCRNKIYTSEVDNPFRFPLLGINTVGTGTILGLSCAAKALSQGQFGQFPLYAFASDGVWALEVSSSGSFSARQPLTRDICVNPLAITQIDSAVIFPSARGLMLLSGSQVACLSDSVSTLHPFDTRSLPSITSLLDDAGIEPASLVSMPFLDLLRDCGIVYDYTHQRLLIFNPRCRYAYLYSLSSRQYTLVSASLSHAVSSYPRAVAQTIAGDILDFAADTLDRDVRSPQFLLTRPLKLDMPDILKTVDTVIQRGDFRRGHVQSVLYGSRDLYNWHLVWSSKDHYLRGFSGTPYKYFRIALLCNLSPDESIFGASLQFTPRLTNQLR